MQRLAVPNAAVTAGASCHQAGRKEELGFADYPAKRALLIPSSYVMRWMCNTDLAVFAVLQAGKIIYTGSIDVADVLEKDGYAGIRRLINEGA